MLLQGLGTADAATGCPGSPLSALRRAALVIVGVSAISCPEVFPKNSYFVENFAFPPMLKTVDAAAIVNPPRERAEARY